MSYRLSRLVLILPVLLAPAFALADHHKAAEEAIERPSFFVSQSSTVTAVVESVNLETREVVLKTSGGETIAFVASSVVRNLTQVEPGDVVTAEYVESMSIEVVANEGYEPEEIQMAAQARAAEGQKPGVAAIDTVIETATVEEIDTETNTFKLRGADGVVRQYVARNPDNLKRARVGDLVVMTVTNAMGISVTERPAD